MNGAYMDTAASLSCTFHFPRYTTSCRGKAMAGNIYVPSGSMTGEYTFHGRQQTYASYLELNLRARDHKNWPDLHRHPPALSPERCSLLGLAAGSAGSPRATHHDVTCRYVGRNSVSNCRSSEINSLQSHAQIAVIRDKEALNGSMPRLQHVCTGQTG
ncbi:hypothetical protein J6590_025954 [Homalodisca vitripennis]|nr:hypothetical protein J6590_025954 [Homalodisca vitripennis]